MFSAEVFRFPVRIPIPAPSVTEKRRQWPNKTELVPSSHFQLCKSDQKLKMSYRRWTGSFHSKMIKLLALLFCASLAESVSHRGPSRISVEPDGGYSGIVIKISDEVSEDNCAEIIKNLQVSNKLFFRGRSCKHNLAAWFHFIFLHSLRLCLQLPTGITREYKL